MDADRVHGQLHGYVVEQNAAVLHPVREGAEYFQRFGADVVELKPTVVELVPFLQHTGHVFGQAAEATLAFGVGQLLALPSSYNCHKMLCEK